MLSLIHPNLIKYKKFYVKIITKITCENKDFNYGLPFQSSGVERSLTRIPKNFLQNIQAHNIIIERINLHFFQITRIPKTFGKNLNRLKYISFAENAITRIPSGIFNNLNLRFVNINSNKINNLPNNFLKNSECSTNICSLNISINKITKLPYFLGIYLRSIIFLSIDSIVYNNNKKVIKSINAKHTYCTTKGATSLMIL